jgi:hypothetical protein
MSALSTSFVLPIVATPSIAHRAATSYTHPDLATEVSQTTNSESGTEDDRLVAATAPVPDGELLQMVRQLEAASCVELELAAAANVLSDADSDYLPAHRRRLEAYNEALGLFDAIERHPAVTMADLQAKARALDWYHGHFFVKLGRGDRQAAPPLCPIARLPVAAPTSAAQSDAELAGAARELDAADQALGDLHRKYGDDADCREDYLDLDARRGTCIATLITVSAKSVTGIQAKAVVLRSRRMIEDYRQHQQIAVSLADDLVEFGPEAIAQP